MIWVKRGFQGFALARNSYEAVSGWLTWKVFHIKHCFDSPAPLPLARSYLHFAFFHGVIASEGNWNWSDIYPPHTKAQSQICCNWKTFGNISSIDIHILPFGTSLEFWLARKKSDLKSVGYLSISPAFRFSFPRLNIQFAEICFGRICIRSDLQMSLFAFGLSFRLINLEINLVHDQMESTRT